MFEAELLKIIDKIRIGPGGFDSEENPCGTDKVSGRRSGELETEGDETKQAVDG